MICAWHSTRNGACSPSCLSSASRSIATSCSPHAAAKLRRSRDSAAFARAPATAGQRHVKPEIPEQIGISPALEIVHLALAQLRGDPSRALARRHRGAECVEHGGALVGERRDRVGRLARHDRDKPADQRHLGADAADRMAERREAVKRAGQLRLGAGRREMEWRLEGGWKP